MTDQQPQILVELGAELERAATRTFSTARTRHGWRGFPRRRFTLTLTATTTACVLAVMIVIGGNHHLAQRERPTPSRHLELAAEFVVLRRPAQPNDAIPSPVLRTLKRMTAFHMFALQPAQSRRLITTASVTVWLLPGPAALCLVARIADHAIREGPGTAVGCSRSRAVENYGAIGAWGNTVAGVVPNGSADVEVVLRDGHTIKLSLAEGGFAFRYRPQDLPLNVYYTNPTGVRQRFHLSPPPPSPHKHPLVSVGQ